MDETKLNTLVGSVLHDLGGAFTVPLVQIGERLGIYEKLHEIGPCTPGELAKSMGLAERYVTEWLCAQAASHYIDYDTDSERFSMTPEQAFIFANPGSPFYLAPAFGAAAAFQDNEPKNLSENRLLLK
jgi:hypothetical protein